MSEKKTEANLREHGEISQQLNEELERKITNEKQLEEVLANLKVWWSQSVTKYAWQTQLQAKRFEHKLKEQMELIKEDEQTKRQEQLNMIANEQQQISNELSFKLEEKTNEAKHLSGQVEALLMTNDMKDTKENHDLKIVFIKE